MFYQHQSAQCKHWYVDYTGDFKVFTPYWHVFHYDINGTLLLNKICTLCYMLWPGDYQH